MHRERPLLIYDGDCNFCRRWIARWQSFTGDRVDYVPFQEAAARFPQIPRENFQASVQLIETNGKVLSGAEAVFQTLAHAPGKRWMMGIYQNLPGVRFLTEWSYRLVARNRVLFSKLTHFLWGECLEPPTYFISSRLFLRLLGLIYLIAFISFWTQADGLIGKNGILPAADFLGSIAKQTGPERYGLVPTLCWLNTSNAFIHFLFAGGVVLSVLLILGFSPSLVLGGLWVFYLSLATVGQDFLEFQWDNLLLETGFLAIFLGKRPSKIVLWLFRWLLFRLMFSSGVMKLVSGDPTWQNLTALQFHYETQPLPTWIGWYAHQLPGWFQMFSVGVMFAIELGIPFLIFMPRRLRLFGCFALITFQGLIAATGNYCFFNLLTVALCFLLLDDFVKWGRFSFLANVKKRTVPIFRWPKWVVLPLAGIILLVSTMQMIRQFRIQVRWPVPAVMLYQLAAPFRTVNPYGLFAVMTTSRPEIIVEGSNDGETWLEYEFKWKPGDLKQRPGFVAPHQPRLDWQMWFAALGTYRQNPWFINFCYRLLQGSPEVLKLLEKNPFSEKPPRYLRALVYHYRFTDPATLHAQGNWWRRKSKGPYIPVLSLRSL